MPSQPEAQGDILKEFREGTFLSSLDKSKRRLDNAAMPCELQGAMGGLSIAPIRDGGGET